jgi:hypothetical protein
VLKIESTNPCDLKARNSALKVSKSVDPCDLKARNSVLKVSESTDPYDLKARKLCLKVSKLGGRSTCTIISTRLFILIIYS